MAKTPEQIKKIALKARQNFAADQQKAPREKIPVHKVATYVISTTAGSTPCLVYSPGEPDRSYPVLVNMHGGGFILGSALDDDVWCRKIANSVPCTVVNIDYHLAPENKFPIALEECYDVIRWLYDRSDELSVDPLRIAVGGQSAGGNLAAALCLLARERQDFPLCYQVLNYPPLDLTLDPFAKPTTDIILPPKLRALFNDCYFRTIDDAVKPLASPLLASDLTKLPPALLITSELDPLRDEALRYEQCLGAAGVTAACYSFTGCMHAFTHFGPKPAAEEALQIVCTHLRQAFGITS